MLRKERKTPITYPTEPDRELLVWEKWITIRKEETMKLSKQTSRPPVDLVMNLCENTRPDKERKIVLEEAQIEKKVKLRGRLWEQAPRLKQGCYCQPVYEIHRTPAELGYPRKIEYIGVPTEIQAQEMGCAGASERVKCNLLENEYHQYRDRREKELQEKISQLDPFRPEISTLIVKGINPPPPKKMPVLPDIKETFESTAPTCENRDEIYALRINNSVFFKKAPGQDTAVLKKIQREPWHEKCTSWSYYFNMAANRAGIGRLYLQNLGTVTIRYCWKKLKKSIPFIPEENEQIFFFNKNEDVISPGQEKSICFIFVSDKPGIYKEHWELSLCNISFFDLFQDKLVIHLLADSVEDFKAKNAAVKQLKSDIYRKSIKNDIYELLEHAIWKSVVVQPKMCPYRKYLLEAEIFTMKNPVCFYHQTEVANMKELYAEMSQGEVWDLSIASWRDLMLTKEYDGRMKYYKSLQKSHWDFLKPWYEGDDLLKSKYRAMRSLLGQLADQFDLVYDRLTMLYMPGEMVDSSSATTYAGRPSRTSQNQNTGSSYTNTESIPDIVRNVFFMQMYKCIGETIESCAGILSSLDSDRWIEFDFCRT